MTQHDIFISYRRDSGTEIALLIKNALQGKGYSTFMDIETLKSGKFDEELYYKIEKSKDVIIILTPGCLDRCINADDWFRQEIKHAIKCDKNIIPVMARGFQIPIKQELPEDISELCRFNGITPDNTLFENSMDRLASKFLKSRPKTFVKQIIEKELKVVIVILLSTFIIFLSYYLSNKYSLNIKNLSKKTDTEILPQNMDSVLSKSNSTQMKSNEIHKENDKKEMPIQSQVDYNKRKLEKQGDTLSNKSGRDQIIEPNDIPLWFMKTTNGPGRRSNFGIIYNFAKEEILLNGGYGPGIQNNHLIGLGPEQGDTWTWDGKKWNIQNAKPIIISNHALTFNKTTLQPVIFGGWSGSRRLNGTFKMSNDNWIEVKTKNAILPGNRQDHSFEYDGKRKTAILFGGLTVKIEFGQFTKAETIALGDTWELDDSVWVKLDVKGPNPRWGTKMVYDEKSGQIILFGGRDGLNFFNDTWSWDGTTATWCKIKTNNSPSARCNHAITYDCFRNKILLFGGQTLSDVPLNDLWEWDGNDWKLLMEHTPPKPRFDHGFVYDVKRNKIILYGGFDGKEWFQDTWELSF